MKLFYHRFRGGGSNFGDNLNQWLWEKILPDVFDDNEEHFFIGFGTILNSGKDSLIPKDSYKIVFSSGVGYGDAPKIDDRWKIYCVRGKESAKALNINESFGIADGAILVRRLYKQEKKGNKKSFMPHIDQANRASELWEKVCKDIDFEYIDPRWDIPKILEKINDSQILLTEAMHGAIVADALRVPWIPIVASPIILSFKWQDWYSSIEKNYKPFKMHPFWGNTQNFYSESKDWVKRKLNGKHLKRIALSEEPILSSDTLINRLTYLLENKIEEFKLDLSNGRFNE